MREIVIISGKGGTGKTSLTAAFSGLVENLILCDADVDAADLHLLLEPRVTEQHPFYGGHTAAVRKEVCVRCETCRELCQFDAINENFTVDPMRCEGCGVCVDFCPEQAVDFPERKSGDWFVSDTRNGQMVHAKLGIAQENSGRLVSLIRKETKKRAEESGTTTILTDGPPGIGCPVIASITGADVLLVVVEPTVSGEHDMQRVVKLANHFDIPCLVCVNKSDLNQKKTEEIINLSARLGAEVAGTIPFDPDFVQAMIEEKTYLEVADDSVTGQAIKSVWQQIEQRALRRSKEKGKTAGLIIN